LAEEQGVLQQKVVALETEVERHDVEIRNLQKQLKEAEQLLVSQFLAIVITLITKLSFSGYCNLSS
jgi:hypothetical protein